MKPKLGACVRCRRPASLRIEMKADRKIGAPGVVATACDACGGWVRQAGLSAKAIDGKDIRKMSPYEAFGAGRLWGHIQESRRIQGHIAAFVERATNCDCPECLKKKEQEKPRPC